MPSAATGPATCGTMTKMTSLLDAPIRILDLGLTWRNSFAQLGPAYSTALQPTPLPEPYLVGLSPGVAAAIDCSAHSAPVWPERTRSSTMPR